MDILPTDGAGAPQRWLIVFRRSGWWFVPGRYKHARAFAFVPECDTYIFYDVGWGTTQIFLARGRGARAAMLQWTRDADVLAFAPRQVGARKLQFAFCCTTALRHLLGLPGGTLRPDGLYRDLLRHGAEVVHGAQTGPATARAGDRSCA